LTGPGALGASFPRSAFDFDISHLALSVARIVFFTAVLGELAGLYAWRRLSYLAAHWWVADIALPVEMAVVAAIILGFRTRAALVLNYPLAFLVLGAARDQYHFDCMIENFAFVFLFAPRPRRLALDAMRPGDGDVPVPRWFSILFFTALALTYADSMHYKLRSESWTSGAAFWLGAANPPFATGILPHALEIPWLMRACTYVVLAYEALFPLVLVRSLRPALVAVGVLMHIGIGVFYPLPWFGLGVAGLVAAFLPIGPRGGPAPMPAALRPWTTAIACALCLWLAGAQLALAMGRPRGWMQEVAGIYRHPIFFDAHFRLAAPLLAFRAVRDGREMPIPSFDARGRPEVRNRYWTLVAVRMRAVQADPQLIDRYLAGWFTKEGWPEGRVRVYAKDVTLRSLDLDFEEDDRVQAAPWRLVREVRVTPYHLWPAPAGTDALRIRAK
jgi:hypothetical protein